MELSRDDTLLLKGVAVCLMVGYHLFAFPERLLPGNRYLPTLLFWDAEAVFSPFGKICVAVFLFLSGYGLSRSSREKGVPLGRYVLTKAVSFYAVYWSVFLVFVPVGILFFPAVTDLYSQKARFVAEAGTFWAGFVGSSSTYNGEWWFVRVYLVLLLAFFPLFSLLLRVHVLLPAGVSLLLLTCARAAGNSHGFLFWQSCLVAGMLAAGHRSPAWPRLSRPLPGRWLALALAGVVAGRHWLGIWFDPLLAPLFVFLGKDLLTPAWLARPMRLLGRYSFPIWLNHSFFCYSFFQDELFSLRYAPLVFLATMGSSLATAVVIEKGRLGVFRFVGKRLGMVSGLVVPWQGGARSRRVSILARKDGN